MIQYQNAFSKKFKASKPFLIAVIGSIFLGASPIFVRLTDIGPISTAFYRVFLALPILWVWNRWDVKKHPKGHEAVTRKDYAFFILAGFFFSLDLIAWHWSLDLTSIVNASLFNNFTPFFVPLFVWIFYTKKPSLLFICAAIIALIGAAILTGESIRLDITHLWGDLFALFSAAAYSAYIIILKQLRDRLDTSVIMLWTTFFNMLILLVCALVSGESFIPVTLNDWIGILGLALLVHVGGQGLLAQAMGGLSAAFIALVLLIAPAVSALLGWVILNEPLGSFQIIGGALILASIAIARQDGPDTDGIAKNEEKESYATRT